MRELTNEELVHVSGAGDCCFCPPKDCKDKKDDDCDEKDKKDKRPGNGYGDQNHIHTGAPGQD